MTTATQTAITAEFAVGFRDLLLQQLENEFTTTAKVIAAVPEGKKDWRPDPNARAAGDLAWHLASVDVGFLNQIADLKFSMDAGYKAPNTIGEIVTWYKNETKKGLVRVSKMTPDQLLTNVDFLGAFNYPAFQYLVFLNNHQIHHRGQFATYLRPMGAKVPGIYGGSFDEPWKG